MAEGELIAAGLLEKLEVELASSSSSGAKKSELERLRNELDVLNTSIEEANGYRMQEDDKQLSLWVEQMRESAELIKGLVEFLVSQSHYPSRAGRLIRGRSNIALNIENIKLLLFNIKKSRGAVVVDRYLNHSHPLNPAVNSLMRSYLVDEKPGQLPLVLIGVDKIGRKTLAKVYESKAVREYFDCCAWITVLGVHRSSEILKLLAKQICTSDCQDTDALNDEEIIGALRHCLRLKRYLLVLDNVWSIMFWFIIKDVLPNDHKRSKVIITTNNDMVATACRSNSFRYTQILPKFWVLNFPDYDREGLYGSEITREHKKCPLLVSAGIDFDFQLEMKRFQQEWEKQIENFVETNANRRGLREILAPCFVDIVPCEIQSCLFYFSIFPRESLVPNDKLFKIWIAEGFVKEKVGKTLEEVAKEYLDKLIDGELVESCKEFYCVEKFSRVHCSIHELVQKEAVEWSFCKIWGVDKDLSLRGKSRRLLISNHNLENVLEAIEESHVRSVFLSSVGALNSSILVRLFEKYKLLTLLDVENSPLELLPHEVGNLLCLKYLSLKSTKVKKLPKSVGKLQKLQTLDITSTLLVELPMEIFKLQNLRHLLASRCENKISLDSAKGVRIKAGIGYLENLQTLMTVEAHLSGIDVIQDLKRLRQLRSLSVSRLTTELSSAMCACIERMGHLESLRLHSMNNESLDLQNIPSPPPHLERLVLKGLLLKFPNWIQILENLSMLCLSLSRLDDDPLQELCHLPSLESLWLYRAYEGEKLHFLKGGFRKLKLLVLRDLQGLEAIEIEEDALPLLQELRIGPSPVLNEVPSGIKHLRDLKAVSFYEMPNEFVLTMKPDNGSEYWKVKHVPSVLIWYRDEGRHYISYQLDQADLWRRLESLNTNIDNFSRRDLRLSFCYSDDEEDSNSASASASASAIASDSDDEEDSNSASASAIASDSDDEEDSNSVSDSASYVQWDHIPQMSFSSDRFTFFTDDVEE